MTISNSDWVLVTLRKQPLDRIHIMKALFLIWHRSGRKIDNFFRFEPYMYGPYSLEVYSELRSLEFSGLLAQPPHPVLQWAKYYLTGQGNSRAEEAIRRFDSNMRQLIDKTMEEVSQMHFFDLLKKVYQEAPDFAVKSVVRELILK